MSFYLHRIPKIIKWYYAEFYWQEKSKEKIIYLTFDDGPTPVVTEFVLKELQKWNAKATFFCLGEHVQSYQNIFNNIVDQGYRFGNHTFSHLDGWKNSTNYYTEDVLKCQETLKSRDNKDNLLFRPPFGRITKSQIKELRHTYNLVLWDYMVGDFDENLSKEKCLQKAQKNIRSGDIVVLHDNQKSYDSLKYVLPELLAHFSKQGYRFKAL